MSLYGFMDYDKADPKNWTINNLKKEKKKKDANIDIDDIDLLDDDEMDSFLTNL